MIDDDVTDIYGRLAAGTLVPSVYTFFYALVAEAVATVVTEALLIVDMHIGH